MVHTLVICQVRTPHAFVQVAVNCTGKLSSLGCDSFTCHPELIVQQTNNTTKIRLAAALHNLPSVTKKHVENFGRIVDRNRSSIAGKVAGHQQLPSSFQGTAPLSCSCSHGLFISFVQQHWCSILLHHCFCHDITPACIRLNMLSVGTLKQQCA